MFSSLHGSILAVLFSHPLFCQQEVSHANQTKIPEISKKYFGIRNQKKYFGTKKQKKNENILEPRNKKKKKYFGTKTAKKCFGNTWLDSCCTFLLIPCFIGKKCTTRNQKMFSS